MKRAARLGWTLAAVLALLAGLAAAAVLLLDTGRGRALVLRALPLYAPQSGLTVAVGRIDGSLFGRLTIHDLALGDPTGVFARAPRVELDWRPLDLARHRLTVRSTMVPAAVVLRRPALRPSADTRILPDLDIVVGRLAIGRLVLAAPVSGIERIVGVEGRADIRDGKVLIDLAATSAGDMARLRLDAEPDRDRFDLAATVVAPAGGTIGRLLGLNAPFELAVGGNGRWSAWAGTATAHFGGAALADLKLSATAGTFAATGIAAPSLLLRGAAQRMTGPAMAVKLTGRVEARTVTTTLGAISPALRLTAAGNLDFGRERFDGVQVDARLLRPVAFNPRLSGGDIRLATTISGSFAAPRVDYALTAPALAWGSTGFEQVRISGDLAGGAWPLVFRTTATAERVTGVGAEIAPLLGDLRIAGSLTLRGGTLAGDRLAVRTARIAGAATLRLDVAGGPPAQAFAVGFDGRLPRYRLGDIGFADLTARLRAVPGPDGLGAVVTGTARLAGTRIGSGLFRSVFDGLPVVTSTVAVAPDQSMRFTGLRLVSPGLTLAGGGTRAPDGTVRLTGTGVSRDYGPAVVGLTGLLDRPQVDIALARPGLGVGLADVALKVVPSPEGWRFEGAGRSSFGPAAAQGLARLAGEAATIDLDATLAGLTARGSIVPSVAGPVTGRMALTGQGITGSIDLAPDGGAQRADLAATADGARLAAATIGRGSVTARVVFGRDVPSITGRFSVADLRTQGLTLIAASGAIADDAGRGTATLAANGVAGTPFDARLDARHAPDQIEATASATIDGKRLALDSSARIERNGAVWSLAPVTLVTPDGRAELSGSFGDGFAVKARLDALGLSLLQLVDRDYDFGGRVTGTVALAVPAAGIPTGAASLRVAGLTRAGLAAASLPVDVAVNAALGGDGASVRAVVVRGGATLGRGQAELDLRGSGGALADRLLAAPLFAQARYTGPAQALWLLGGVEALDVRGPVAVAVDVGGRLTDPVLSGTVRSTGGRVENATLGTVVDNISLDGRFAGSRFDLTGFSGTVGKDGRISGIGGIDLSAERGFPVDVRVQLDNAQLLDRDDLRATATGPLRLQSTRDGGRITGTLDVARARFRIGRTQVVDVPVVTVSERNVELLGRTAPRVARPTSWSLDITATARDDLEVIGLGLDSEWRGALRLTGRATAPELTGRIRLVRGNYDFAGKRFELVRGDLRFAGGYPPDPVIDITAENTSSGFTAQLALTGTGLRPDIKFGSTPALPEDEVLARVLFGTSITTLSAPEAVQLAGALASLRSGGGSTALNPIDAVRKGLRIDRLRILPADVATGRKTAVAAGQYIGRRLYVELSTDAQGYSASAIEVSLTRSLSILSDVATLGGTSVNLRLKKDY